MASSEHPVWRGHSKEAKRRQPCGPRITRNCAVMGSLLLPCAPTWLFLVAGWCLMGATPRGQPWTLALMLPHGRDGLSARRLAVWWTFHEPSLGRHVLHELMRNAVLNLTLIIPATACHQRNYVERYSRYKKAAKKFFRKLLKGLRYVPRVIITDKLKSYGAAKRERLPSVEHRQSRSLKNRCESSHRPPRQRERRMQGLKSAGHA